VGLSDRVEYLLVDPHRSDSEQGIFQSHLTCIRKGLAAGAATIAVFEDDVVFDRFCARRLREAALFMTGRPGGWILFFGCLVRRSRPTTCRAVRAIDYRCMAHAYAVDRSAAKLLTAARWRGVPFDIMLQGLAVRHYAVCPTFAFQTDFGSDNWRHRRLEAFRRAIGGLDFIQRMNEGFHRHRLAVILAHMAFFAAAAVWLLHRWMD
jgi:GR25 family glycosyltransferase involved in LPS biosynthesis